MKENYFSNLYKIHNVFLFDLNYNGKEDANMNRKSKVLHFKSTLIQSTIVCKTKLGFYKA